MNPAFVRDFFCKKVMYRILIKPIFFLFDPERIHKITFGLIGLLHKIPFFGSITRFQYQVRNPALATELFGIQFPNPVGLAAGFDKDAKLFRELANYGFGFIEIGTLTPLPQKGNPKKRLFRLPADSALINRMGFNNEGVAAAVKRLRKNKHLIIGGNIGKNKDTPNENAVQDYEYCFKELHPFVHYFVVNVSSPNTPNLRALQDKKPLSKLLHHLVKKNEAYAKPKPILLKIAPDLNEAQLLDIISIVKETKIHGVIATNTTIAREKLRSESKATQEHGGLSGKPLHNKSTEVIRFLSQKSNKAFPIIGVGGIHTPDDALEKLNAGASLVQLYTGFVYEGPGLVKRINRRLLEVRDSANSF